MDENEVILKKGFFKKVWYSIFKLERYGEMSAEGLGRAFIYIIQLSLIFALVLGLTTIYQINEKVQKGITFLDEQVGNFNYNEGILKLEKDEPVIAPSSTLGTIIIDTNIESQEDVNKYLNSLDTNMGIILLKDKLIIKGLAKDEIIDYEYSTLLGNVGITKFDKQDTIKFLNSNNIWNFYVQIFIIVLPLCLISTVISVLITAFFLSVFGCIATLGAKIKIRYVAIFNLTVYSLTLSMLLQALYVIVNVTTGFNIKYFQVMYIAVAAIYLIASIFLIKSEFIKKQMQELQNQQGIKEKENKNEEPKEEKKDENTDNNDNTTKDKPKEDNKEDKGKEPEGSEA